MFQGSSALSLDAKGRMSIPTRHRNAFVEADGSFVTLTRHPDGCLLLYPRPTWLLKREALSTLPLSARAWQRIFLGNAVDVEVDANGRVLISPELREAAGLNKEVMLMGMGSHFELWDVPTLMKKEREAIEAGVPDSIAGFSL
jgi:MraZ protein